MKYLKSAALVTLMLCLLIGIETLLLMLASGRLVNSLALPIFNNLDFLWLLLKSNPWSGLLELISQPVLIIGQAQPSADGYLAALYYYPVSSLLHLCLAGIIVTRFHAQPASLLRPRFIIGSGLLLVAINYVWLASCCGATPGWTLDTLFLHFTLTATGYPQNWMELYEAVYGWMQALQLFAIAVAGALLWRRLESKDTREQSR